MSPCIPERVAVCSEDELKPEQSIRVLLDGHPVLVARDDLGTIHAVDDTCTHAEISLAEGFIEGRTVECWAHGARFDLATGVARTLPATEPLRSHPVYVEDGIVYVGSVPPDADES